MTEKVPDTNDSFAELDELLEQKRQEIESARPENVQQLFRDYLNLYLEYRGHPEVNEVADQGGLTDLSEEINATLSSSPPGITVNGTRELLEALLISKSYPSVDPSVKSVHTEAEPVMMFNGEFVHEFSDFTLNGAGIEFAFKRIYKSQVAYNGPLGHKWDYRYNLWLRVSGDTIFRSTGSFSEEDYFRHPKFGQAGFNYWVPPDGQAGLIYQQGQSFVWRSPQGERHIFEQDVRYVFLHRIKKITDKHGNYLEFSYPDDNHIIVQVNHSQRRVQINSNDNGKIVSISDYNGRIWRYVYDDFGDLSAVITPPTDRYPNGLVTRYEYSSSEYSSRELQHNLVRIIDPAGQVYLENEYGLDKNTLTYNRIVVQRQGNGLRFFDYQNIVEDFQVSYSDLERPAFQTNLVERNGQSIHYIYNKFGNLILREEYILQDGLPMLAQWRYRYNGDGALIATLTPDGKVTQYLYGRDYYLLQHNIDNTMVRTHAMLTDFERMKFGNVLTIVRRGRRYDFLTLVQNSSRWGGFFPDIISDVDPSDIISKITYEPYYQQISISSDPRFTSSADPARPEAPLTLYTYMGPPGDPNRYLAAVQYPDITRPDGNVLQNIVQTYDTYDPNGRLLRSTDQLGIVTSYTYFPHIANPAHPDAVKEGYLKTKTLDATALSIPIEFGVNSIGLVTAVTKPKGILVSPGLYITSYEFNTLNQVINNVLSPPFSFRSNFYYDENGNIEREEIDLKDEFGVPMLGGKSVKLHAFDEQNNKISESIGGMDPSTMLTVRNTYDESDELLMTTKARGNRITKTYDERMYDKTLTRGLGSEEASTVKFEYTLDGLKKRSFDGLGKKTIYKYDAFDRLVELVDPAGNVHSTSYDKAGNITMERTFENRSDGFYIIQWREHEYDELNHKTVTLESIFQTPIKVTDFTAFSSQPPAGDLSRILYFYDKKGRLEMVTNPLNFSVQFQYDGLDRKILELDAEGNYTKFSYDPNGNLTRRDTHEVVRDVNSGQVLGEEVFSVLMDYDELDRLSQITDNLGNVTTYHYDSLNRIVRKVDALGNTTRYEFDVHGHKTSEIVEMTSDGTGSGTFLAPIISRFEFDSNGNQLSFSDGNSNKTISRYDSLDRKHQVIYPDLSMEQFHYDRNDNYDVIKDNNGLKRILSFDSLNRLVRLDLDLSEMVDSSAIENLGAFEEYKYDGLGRTTEQKNECCNILMDLDSAGRAYSETINYHVNSAPVQNSTIKRKFDFIGNLLELTYPNGRIIKYHLDKINRITRIENRANGPNYPGLPRANPNYDIELIHFDGHRRKLSIFGNRTRVNFAYDGIGRPIEMTHQIVTGNRLRIQTMYDAVGNARVKNDIDNNGQSEGSIYEYNSTYWLNSSTSDSNIPMLNPIQFSPPNIPIQTGNFNGQRDIDTFISSVQMSNNPSYDYSFDLAGNRTELKVQGQPFRRYLANNLNQYYQVNNVNYYHDLNGNVTQDDRHKYFYDYRNRLVRVRDDVTSRNIIRSYYDVRGRRILAVTRNATRQFVYDGQNLLEEYQNSGLFAQFVSEFDLDSLCQMAAGGDDFWYHKDITNSTRLLTGSAGTVRSEYSYSDFGSPKQDSNRYNPFKFMGRFLDRETNLYDFRARSYSPTLERFMQRDTSFAMNAYLFVHNNPLKYTDPTGNEAKSSLEAESPDPNKKEISEMQRWITLWILAGDPYFDDTLTLAERIRRTQLISDDERRVELAYMKETHMDTFGHRDPAFSRLTESSLHGGLAGGALIAKAALTAVELWAMGEVTQGLNHIVFKGLGRVGAWIIRRGAQTSAESAGVVAAETGFEAAANIMAKPKWPPVESLFAANERVFNTALKLGFEVEEGTAVFYSGLERGLGAKGVASIAKQLGLGETMAETWGGAYLNALEQGGLKLSTRTWTQASVNNAMGSVLSGARMSFIRGGIVRPDAIWKWEKFAIRVGHEILGGEGVPYQLHLRVLP